jgi:hypothetical protein
MAWGMDDRSIDSAQRGQWGRRDDIGDRGMGNGNRGIAAVYVEPCPHTRGYAIACRCFEPPTLATIPKERP